MKIYFNGWFSGFIEKTNPGLHVDFFLNLFEKVYGAKCFVGSLSDSNILCEFDMLIGCNTLVTSRIWQHTYLFSGESTLKCNKQKYTCVLWGERNHENVINIPLFIPYIYTNNFVDKLEECGCVKKNNISFVPTKDVCVVVSNPKGLVRNKFLNKLDKIMRVDYLGGYNNNMNGCIPYAYNTPEFLAYVSQYKFIISMENSREDTYITEKVVHGLLAKTIPIYWGSNRIYDYINKERILALLKDNNDTEMDALIERMIEIKQNENKYLQIVNNNTFTNSKLERTIDIIARDIRCLLNMNKECWNNISRIYCISNPDFEPERCVILQKMFDGLKINSDYVSYISPTYKHTITEEIYNKNIKEQFVFNLRRTPMKKGELSLFLNYKAVLEDIEKNYRDNEMFFIFESDVMISNEIEKLDLFLDNVKNKEWNLMHLGMYQDVYGIPFTSNTGFRTNSNSLNNELIDFLKLNCKNKRYIEDITNENESFRVIRKFHTRCTDSFLWNYKGVKLFLNYMKNIKINYGVPFDYYMCDFLENNLEFKHYWSINEFFKQGSNIGLIPTTLQDD